MNSIVKKPIWIISSDLTLAKETEHLMVIENGRVNVKDINMGVEIEGSPWYNVNENMSELAKFKFLNIEAGTETDLPDRQFVRITAACSSSVRMCISIFAFANSVSTNLEKEKNISSTPLSEDQDVLQKIEDEHDCVLAKPDNRGEQIEEFEKHIGYKLPADLRQFYLRFEQATLFNYFKILSFEEIEFLKKHRFPDGMIAASWLPFVDNGNVQEAYIAIDLSTTTSSGNPIIDLEAVKPDFYVAIGSCFNDFLTKTLRVGSDDCYWDVDKKLRLYTVHFTPGSRYFRSVNRQYWETLDDTPGSGTCQSDGCNNANLSVSAYCKQHHYERQEGHSCPFVENAVDFPERVEIIPIEANT